MDKELLRLECLKLVVQKGQGPFDTVKEAKVYEEYLYEKEAPPPAALKPQEVKSDKKPIIIGKKSGNSELLT